MSSRTNVNRDLLVIENRGYASTDMTIKGVAAHADLKAGAVLSVDTGATSSEKGKLFLTNKSSATVKSPDYVLLKDVQAQSTDVVIPRTSLLAAGVVNASKLSFLAGTTYTDVHTAAKNNGIIFESFDELSDYDNG